MYNKTNIQPNRQSVNQPQKQQQKNKKRKEKKRQRKKRKKKMQQLHHQYHPVVLIPSLPHTLSFVTFSFPNYNSSLIQSLQPSHLTPHTPTHLN